MHFGAPVPLALLSAEYPGVVDAVVVGLGAVATAAIPAKPVGGADCPGAGFEDTIGAGGAGAGGSTTAAGTTAGATGGDAGAAAGTVATFGDVLAASLSS